MKKSFRKLLAVLLVGILALPSGAFAQTSGLNSEIDSNVASSSDYLGDAAVGVASLTSPAVFATSSGIANESRLAAGDAHSAFIDDNGALWTWGANDSGQLGDGTKTNSLTPKNVMRNVKVGWCFKKYDIAQTKPKLT